MKQTLTCLWGFALAVVLLSSCKKDDVTADILLSTTWKPGMQDKNPASGPHGSIRYSAVLTCQQDDTYRFDSKGKLTINQGTNKCSTDEPATKSLSYSYNRETKELIIDGIRYTVVEETEEQVKYYVPVAYATGSEYLVYLLHKN